MKMDDHSTQLDILFAPGLELFALVVVSRISKFVGVTGEGVEDCREVLGWGCQEQIQGATRKRSRSSWNLKWCWCVFCWLLFVGSRSSSDIFLNTSYWLRERMWVLYSKWALRRCFFFLKMLAFAGDQDAKDAGVQILGFSSTSQKEEGHGVAKKAESDVLLQVAWK